MENEGYSLEEYSLNLQLDPMSFYLDLDQLGSMMRPIKDVRVIVLGETFIFTKEQIHSLLKKLQKSNHEK